MKVFVKFFICQRLCRFRYCLFCCYTESVTIRNLLISGLALNSVQCSEPEPREVARADTVIYESSCRGPAPRSPSRALPALALCAMPDLAGFSSSFEKTVALRTRRFRRRPSGARFASAVATRYGSRPPCFCTVRSARVETRTSRARSAAAVSGPARPLRVRSVPQTCRGVPATRATLAA